MSKKEKPRRKIFLQVQGGVVPLLAPLDEEDAVEHESRAALREAETLAALERGDSGAPDRPYVKRNRRRLMRAAAEKDMPGALGELLRGGKSLPLDQFSELLDIASRAHNTRCAAVLLGYRKERYSEADIEAYEDHRLDAEMGLAELSASEYRHIFRFRYSGGGIAITGFRDSAHDIEVPAVIGGRRVISVNAEALYEKAGDVKITRKWPAKEESTGNAGNESVPGAFEKYRWRVLAGEDGKKLLFCEDAVACLPYHMGTVEATWETCRLRSWLNDVFLLLCFTDEERASILDTEVSTENNRQFGTDAGSDTTDKLFLLSIEEAKRYLPEAADRDLGHWWWLRSPGDDRSFAATVTPGGKVSMLGGFIDSDDYSVHPAMWISSK